MIRPTRASGACPRSACPPAWNLNSLTTTTRSRTASFGLAYLAADANSPVTVGLRRDRASLSGGHCGTSVLGTTVSAPVGGATVTWLSDGCYRFTITATDDARHSVVRSSATLIVDHTASIGAFSAPAAGTYGYVYGGYTARWSSGDSGSGLSRAVLEILRGRRTSTSSCSGTSYSVISRAAMGATGYRSLADLAYSDCYRFRLTLVDRNGNSRVVYSGIRQGR